MLTEAQIRGKLEAVVDAIKAVRHKQVIRDINLDGKIIWEKHIRPEYYDTYFMVVEWMERIEPHAKKGVIPYDLLSKKSPNQTEREWQYVLENYKQSTLPVFQDFVNTLQRAWHDASWDIKYNEDESKYATNSYQAYVEDGIEDTPLNMPLETYVKSVVPTVKLIDSMGVLAVRPWQIPLVEENGEMVMSGELVEPIPIYFDSSRVVAYKENKWYMLEAHYKSYVQHRGQRQKMGYVFEVYDDDKVWVISQKGIYTDWEFDIEVFYEHNLGYVPVTRLKGIPITEEGEILWQSPFLTVVDILDQAIMDDCNLRSVKANCVYPYRVMIGDLCDHKEEIDGAWANCNQGYIYNASSNSYSVCSKCGGTGSKDRVSPVGQMLIKPETGIAGEGDNIKPSEAMAYISPPVDTPAFLRKEIIEFISHARQLLHLKTTNSIIQGAEDFTASGMALDEKAKFAFIKQPTDQIFDIYLFLSNCIGEQRYGASYQGIKLAYPSSFDFKTEGDYLAEISESSRAGLPPMMMFSVMERFLRSLFYSDEEISAIYETLLMADRLMSLNESSIAMKTARKQVANWEVILHDSGIQLVRELMQEREGYLDLEMMERVSLLHEKAKSKEEKPDNTVDTIMNTLTNGITEPPPGDTA